MSFGTYRQYDSRWGKKNYNGSSNYAQAGCGPTACANILYAINPSITPLTTGNYMKSHGYAIRNNGTAWNGIPACLKAFGATDVRQVDKMSDVFSLMSKGYVGVFLFRAGTRGGIKWTSSGHYIAVTGYKHANGKHYIRTFDSGGRKHDGFFCYETNMKGLLPRIWLCKVTPPQPIKKPTGSYAGPIPQPTIKVGSKGDNVKNLQKFLNWYHPAWKLKVDGICGNATANAVREFQRAEGITADAIYGKNSRIKAEAYIRASVKPVTMPTPVKTPTPVKSPSPYAGAWPDFVAHSGQKIAYTARDLAYAKGTSKAKYTYPKGKAKAAFTAAINKVYPKRSSWSKQCQAGASCDVGAGTIIRYSGVDAKVPRGLSEQLDHFKKSSLWKNTGLKKCSLAGDVAMQPSPSAHIWIGLGDGNIAEANHTWKFFEHIVKDTRKINGKAKSGVYRCTKSSPIKKGDRGTEVIKWQKFLNWAGFNCGAADGVFGDKGVSATKAFQKSVGITQDGVVGNGTITKAKAVKR